MIKSLVRPIVTVMAMTTMSVIALYSTYKTGEIPDSYLTITSAIIGFWFSDRSKRKPELRR